MTTWNLPRETIEWVGPVTVTADGEPATAVELALLPLGTRPAGDVWQAPLVLDGGQGLLVNGLAPDRYVLWARVTDAPETPVLEVGTVRVT